VEIKKSPASVAKKESVVYAKKFKMVQANAHPTQTTVIFSGKISNALDNDKLGLPTHWHKLWGVTIADLSIMSGSCMHQ